MRHAIVAVGALVSSSALAHADDVHDRIGLSFVAAADSASAHAAGLPGAHLELAHWRGPMAIVGEGGHVRDADSEGGSWIGGGLRVAFASTQLDHGPDWFRVIGWTQVGAARELWELRDGGSLARNHVHAGLGITALGGRHERELPVAAQVWFRVQRADAAGSDMDDVPDRVNMILGLGLLVGL